jgi:UDP-glucose 4-epimerase
MSKYLVTGAAGFIGGALAKALLVDGNEVYTIDNLSTGFIDAIPEGVKFIHGNCQDEKIVSQLNDIPFDAIFHIAGQSSGEISYDNPIYDLQTNAQSTLLLLQLAMRVNCNSFIYASTMSVYGDQPDKRISEDSYLSPKSFYGVGKIASEHYMRIYEEYGINCTALRLFNVYGPGQNMHNLRQGMVSIYLAQALNSGHIIVKGSPERFRDLVYIDDVVHSFIRASKSTNVGYSCFNVCTGIKTTVQELLEIISKSVPGQCSIEFAKGTPGDQHGIYGDNSKIYEAINWRPNIDVLTGLRKMIKWAIN